MLERYRIPVPVTGHVWGQPSKSLPRHRKALVLTTAASHRLGITSPHVEYRCRWPYHSNVVMVLHSQLQDLGSERAR